MTSQDGYAANVDYQSLYGGDYYGHDRTSASFDVSALPNIIASRAVQSGVDRVVDVGGGNGLLRELLLERGLSTVALDYSAAAGADIAVNIATADPAARDALLARLNASEGAWLLTCFDVLEHIDVEDLADALWWLHSLTHGRLIASITTRPSSDDNAYHCTILPRATWRALFLAAGFSFVEVPWLDALSKVRPSAAGAKSAWLTEYWQRFDLFDDHALGEPWYFEVVRDGSALTIEALRARISEILGVAGRAEKRRQFGDLSSDLVFSIGSMQDFLTFRPLFDVTPRKKTHVLLRAGLMRQYGVGAFVDAMTGFFRRNGVNVQVFDRIAEIDWSSLRAGHLLSASESTAALGHVLNLGVVAHARALGMSTTLLQHGIWVESFAERIVTVASQDFLTWASSPHQDLSGLRTRVLGEEMAAAVGLGERLRPIGSPKYAELDFSAPDFLARRVLGDRQFDKVVFAATNFHWSAHTLSKDRFVDRVRRYAERHPRNLVIVKCHPAEKLEHYGGLRAPNVLLLDDVLCLCLDAYAPALLRGADAIVSPLSTMLLDAHLAGAGLYPIEMGSQYGYSHVSLLDVDAAFDALEANAAVVSHADAAAFQATYADACAPGFYERFGSYLSAAHARGASPLQAVDAGLQSLSRHVEDLWIASIGR